MPPPHGISVEIIRPDNDEELVDTRDHGDAQTHDSFKGDIISSSICVPAGERIAILIGFQTRRGFVPCSASGVSVTISIAGETEQDTLDHSQTWWVPKKCFGNWNKEKGYNFGEVTKFKEDGSVDEVMPMRAPVPVNSKEPDPDATFGREPLEWQLDEIPNKGSIIIAIQRGHLVEKPGSDQSPQPWTPTCPHESSRQVNMLPVQPSGLLELTECLSGDAKDQVKIIDPAWFKRMRGDNGDPCLWEFKNVQDLSSVAKSRMPKTPDAPRHRQKMPAPLYKTANPWRELQESLKLFPDPPSDREILEEQKRRVREEQLAREQEAHNHEPVDGTSFTTGTRDRIQSSATPGSDSMELPSSAATIRQAEDVSTQRALGPSNSHSPAATPSTQSLPGDEGIRVKPNPKATAATTTNRSETSAVRSSPNEVITVPPGANNGILPTPPTSIARSTRGLHGPGAHGAARLTGSATPSASASAAPMPGSRNASEQDVRDRDSHVVDLTENDDTDVVPVKREHTSDESSAAKKQKTAIEESEDLEDLEDQLLEVGLRRKIRAMKRRDGKGVKIEL
ncbi:hypothetical protein PRZ48_003972 [Zasmidium cellare]|uniref:Uncharacterized protein n=1 Tax=Zasmidium cellare TaxID=395010 RepID=A0ABR0EWK4_ZASCE|nr:hypothetical protein PRZ48_003972 [Zasmidium cellare]